MQEQIIKTEFSEVMQKSFIDYSMSVIIDRALPDARDGLKPVQRRTLYDMMELGTRFDRPHRKCARIVGDTMGKYHPHGDSSIYDALVVMAQDFKKGIPLVDGHGNFGTIEGDGAAAMRYTEARLAEISEKGILSDLDKDVVDFVPNFDETEKEPSVLPCKFPNLLVNGAEGIAVGMVTSIPTHNLAEVIDATKAYIKDNNITVRELMKYLPGPDFPTGGIVCNKDELLSIYESGVGKIKLRGKVDIEKSKNGKTNVVISEIPYTMIGANISKFLMDIADLYESKKAPEIVDITNQSSKEGVRIVIELKKDADAENFVNLLYKKTRLEDTFGVNMLAIYQGRPEIMGLKDAIKANVDFQFEVNTRKYTTLLRKEQEKKEIQEGLIKACNVIDLIIEILRGSKDRNMAKACLVEGKVDGIKFKTKESKIMATQLQFTENQANAILEMRLYRLIGLEVEALIKEHDETMANIYLYEDILDRKDSMAQVIMSELDELKKKFKRPRRTLIENSEAAVYVEKEAEDIPVMFLMDRFGYIKSIDMATFERNKDAAISENKYIVECKSSGKICIFTNKGNLHTIKVSDVPFGKFRDKSVPVDNISNFDTTKEEVVAIFNQSQLNLFRLLFVTKYGYIKTVDGGEFDVSKRTVASTKLEDDDEVISIFIAEDSKFLVLQSAMGYFLKFPSTEVPDYKKGAVGCHGMKLKEQDYIENVAYANASENAKITWKDKEVDFNKLKVAARNSGGTKIRV